MACGLWLVACGLWLGLGEEREAGRVADVARRAVAVGVDAILPQADPHRARLEQRAARVLQVVMQKIKTHPL